MKRRTKIETQFPDFIGWLIQAMKAGLTLPKALELASKEMPRPIREELENILDRVKTGQTLEESLLKSALRLKIPDYSFFVHSVAVLRQIGGNFVEHFEGLARILRERQKVSAKIKTATAQGKVQGNFLALLPFFLGFSLSFLSPDFLAPLWQTPLGWFCAALILLLDIGGWLWVQRWAKVEV